MPTYRYRCPEGHVHEELKKVSEHETNPCPECGVIAQQEITPVHLDWRMGVDLAMPTMADKWARIQKQKAAGEMWDSNNERYGGNYKDT